MVNCSECGSAISKHANPCPHCGAKRMTPGRYLFWGIIISIILLYKTTFYQMDKRERDHKAEIAAKHLTTGAILKSSDGKLVEKTTTTTDLSPAISKLSLTYSWRTVFLMDGFIVDGNLQNTNNFTVNSILITCKSYDHFANQVGTQNHPISGQLTAYQTTPVSIRMDKHAPTTIHSVTCNISNAVK